MADASAAQGRLGDFEKACRQAWRMWENGTEARVASSLQHARLDHPLYQRHHVIEAIHDFRSARGFWPTQWEYEQWARCGRRTMRLTGEEDPRPVAAAHPEALYQLGQGP